MDMRPPMACRPVAGLRRTIHRWSFDATHRGPRIGLRFDEAAAQSQPTCFVSAHGIFSPTVSATSTGTGATDLKKEMSNGFTASARSMCGK